MDREAFERFINERRRAPFEWGRNDCCLFVADAVLTLTGRDYAAELRGYRTALGAARRIKKLGSLDAYLDSLFAPVAVGFAKRYDPVLFQAEGGPALGICIGTHFAAVSKHGLSYIGLAHAEKAWKCPQQY